MNRMLLALTALLLPCSVAIAAGLGKITVLSALGQPLKAEIEIVALQPGEGETLSARLAAVDSFRQAGIEFNGALLNVKFAVERRPNGQHVVSMTSSQPISEPFIDMLVELNWANGRLTREYTFLLDPPEYKGPSVASPAPPVTPPIAEALPAPVSVPAQTPAAPAAPEARPLAADVTKPAAVAAPSVPAPARSPLQAAQNAEATYTVKRGDTLAKIALQTKYEGVTLQQSLTALYRGNTDAFDGNNMNRLRAGKILNIPGREVAAAVTQEEARNFVNAQSADYQVYRTKIGAVVAAAPARSETGRQSAGRITAPREDKPAPSADASKDQLRLSRPDDGKSGARAGGAGKADDIAAKDKALKEANERIALLEKNLQQLPQLAQLKSGAAAQVQESAKAAVAGKADTPKPAPSPAPAAVVAPIPAPAPVATPAPAPAPAPTGDAGKAAAAAKAEPIKGEVAKGDAQKGDSVKGDPGNPTPPPAVADVSKPAPDAVKPAPKPPAKAITPPPPPTPPPSFVDELLDDPIAMGAGGAVIVGLFGYGFYALRKKRKAQAANASSAAASAEIAALPPSAMGASSVLAPEGEHHIDTSAIQSDISPAGAIEAEADEIDPIAEADVYMQYGRDSQAEDILKDALARDSSRQAIKVKLLEIYANRKDSASFDLVARDLHEATGGVGADWEKAAAMGAVLDPGNPLYGAGSASSTEMDMASTQILDTADLAPASPPAAPDLTLDHTAAEATPESSSGLDFDLDLGAGLDQAPSGPDATMDVAVGAQGDSSSSGLDFDLDLGSGGGQASSESQDGGDIAPIAKGEPTSTGMDFDLDLGSDKPKEEPIDFSASVALKSETGMAGSDAASTGGESSGGLDIDFDLPASDIKPAEATASDSSSSGLDFNLLGETPNSPTEVQPSEMDLSTISFDLDTPGNGAAEAPVMDAHWQEVATKLDLAKAYQDMGDKDGARELLNEVLSEGDQAQQTQAKSLLGALEA
ncbi:MAG: LysM peptidoglycan-binding domain-containing protein [Betaproteobacteria bacterium]|nr:LysM peptidoglycan-binding domain-containing protein [Betaproteobacteria bacterium]